MAKIRTIYLLVDSGFACKICKTQATVRKQYAANAALKMFQFQDEVDARAFQERLKQSANPKEEFEKLQGEYYKLQLLKPYQDKLMQPEPGVKLSEEGLSVNLRRQRRIFVVKQNNDYPKVYLSPQSLKKNGFDFKDVSSFDNEQSALQYIEALVLERLKATSAQSQSEDSRRLPQIDLQSLEARYKDMVKWQHLKTLSKQSDPNIQMMLKCGQFCTLHNHSAVAHICYQFGFTGTFFKNSYYIGQKYTDLACLVSVLYGVRACVFYNVLNVRLLLTNSLVYHYLTKMKEPSHFASQLYLAAIKDYSALLKVQYELVPTSDMQEVVDMATKEFQRHSFVKKRSKKFS